MFDTILPQTRPNAYLQVQNIPLELKQRKQWVLWRLEPRKSETEETTKVPYQVSGEYAKSDTPSTWNSFDNVLSVYSSSGKYSGIGYVISVDDPYIIVDIDHCYIDGMLTNEATLIVQKLYSFTEISQSGEGLHIIVKGKKPKGPNRKKNTPYEIYDKDRYFALTGNILPNYGLPISIEENQEGIEKAYKIMFPAKVSFESSRTTGSPAGPVNLGDSDLIEKIKNSTQGSKFISLYYNGDLRPYNGNHSSADQALCNILAWWTRGDYNKMDRIFRTSALYREKWEREDYAKRTINEAIAGTPGGYSGRVSTVTDQLPKKTFSQHGEEVEIPTFNLTDLGNAERLKYYYGPDIHYCHTFNKWLVWDGKRWAIDNTGAIERKARDTVRKMYAEALTIPLEEVSRRKELAKYAMSSESSKKIKSMIEMLRILENISISSEDLDNNIWLINCENGTVNLKTGQLQEYNRVDLITKLTPAIYDPDATAPIWDKFLNRIMAGNEKMIAFLQKAIGYSLTGNTGERVMFILHGSGSNGKSTLLETISGLLGPDYAQQTPTNTLMIRKNDSIPNDIARLRGSRFVSAVEAEEGQRLAESLIKQLTGGDRIAARFMRGEFFEFKPEFKLFLGTNHRPNIKGTDPAIWGRIKLIPFDVVIPAEEKDKDLLQKLKTEYSGILNWAIKGCLTWQREGLGEPPEIKRATEQYRAEMDVVGSFLDEACILNADYKVPMKDLYKAYGEWCDNYGERPLKNREFTARLTERGYIHNKSTGGLYYWFGIGLVKINLE